MRKKATVPRSLSWVALALLGAACTESGDGGDNTTQASTSGDTTSSASATTPPGAPGPSPVGTSPTPAIVNPMTDPVDPTPPTPVTPTPMQGAGGGAPSSTAPDSTAPSSSEPEVPAGNGGNATEPVEPSPETDPVTPEPATEPVATEEPEPVTPAPTTDPTPVDSDRSVEGTCARWNADRAEQDEGTWSGNVDSCDPGDISAEGRTNALRLLNLYRWLADLPEVETDPERNQFAQACALLQYANDSLSHEPPEDWLCFSDDGAFGASTSNISGGPGVMSVDLYLLDDGNESTMGHRRIILSNSFGPVGLGSTGPGGYSCMQNNDGEGDAGKAWMAWPPPGVFPLEAYELGRSTLGDTGWSVQSEDMDLGSAQVTVTSSGTELAVDFAELEGNYGNSSGLRINPNGWDAEAGQTYTVNISGIDTPISYEFQIVDCSAE